MPPPANPRGMGQNWAMGEHDLFRPGLSWAICFFEAVDPMVVEFRPPKVGSLNPQSFAVYIPNHHLNLFANISQERYSWEPRLYNSGGHCTLKIFKCDVLGLPEQWRYTFRAYYDYNAYQDGNFKFVSIGRLEGEMEHGYYFMICEFHRGQWEAENPDAKYVTGVFVIY
ncbi:hypothetical protein GGS24DRAFT_500665 [Hypoxylon argillaceum]|nr:hypothetical protein GGS24DRAFT_500665 [Hypoxylon argillaceum]KAI1154295.1 hypothetical protein F4825DRAFT_472495 [Nemania diffusa]